MKKRLLASRAPLAHALLLTLLIACPVPAESAAKASGVTPQVNLAWDRVGSPIQIRALG